MNPSPPAEPVHLDASHAFAAHTAEVRLDVRAPTLPALYAEAARGTAELMSGVTEPKAALGPVEHVLVDAGDPDALLVAWLNELLFLSEVHKRIYSDVRVDELTGTTLSASVRGWEPPFLRTAVKAATLHGLKIAAQPGGFTASVVLDV